MGRKEGGHPPVAQLKALPTTGEVSHGAQIWDGKGKTEKQNSSLQCQDEFLLPLIKQCEVLKVLD